MRQPNAKQLIFIYHCLFNSYTNSNEEMAIFDLFRFGLSTSTVCCFLFSCEAKLIASFVLAPYLTHITESSIKLLM